VAYSEQLATFLEDISSRTFPVTKMKKRAFLLCVPDKYFNLIWMLILIMPSQDVLFGFVYMLLVVQWLAYRFIIQGVPGLIPIVAKKYGK
jgi:hypothetical protein